MGLAATAPTVAQGDALLAQLAELRADAAALQQRAERVSDVRAALLAIREQARLIEVLLQVAGELQTAPTTNIIIAPQWVAVRTVVLQALAPYADARQAVAEALRELES